LQNFARDMMFTQTVLSVQELSLIINQVQTMVTNGFLDTATATL